MTDSYGQSATLAAALELETQHAMLMEAVSAAEGALATNGETVLRAAIENASNQFLQLTGNAEGVMEAISGQLEEAQSELGQLATDVDQKFTAFEEKGATLDQALNVQRSSYSNKFTGAMEELAQVEQLAQEMVTDFTSASQESVDASNSVRENVTAMDEQVRTTTDNATENLEKYISGRKDELDALLEQAEQLINGAEQSVGNLTQSLTTNAESTLDQIEGQIFRDADQAVTNATAELAATAEQMMGSLEDMTDEIARAIEPVSDVAEQINQITKEIRPVLELVKSV